MWFELDPVLETGLTSPSGELETFDDMFSAIQCPTLIIRGAVEKGGILSDGESDRLTRLIPDSQTLSWPKVGHSPHIARNHDFIRALKRFHPE
jgi:pimeloyl-ACP methyl ester carboxylesterase